jgi:hypothetical protein
MDADLGDLLARANANQGPFTHAGLNLQYHQVRATLLQVEALRELKELLKARLHSPSFPRR